MENKLYRWRLSSEPPKVDGDCSERILMDLGNGEYEFGSYQKSIWTGKKFGYLDEQDEQPGQLYPAAWIYAKDLAFIFSEPIPSQNQEDWDNFREQWLVGQVQSLRHSGFSETKASEIAVQQWNELSSSYHLIKKEQ